MKPIILILAAIVCTAVSSCSSPFNPTQSPVLMDVQQSGTASPMGMAAAVQSRNSFWQ